MAVERGVKEGYGGKGVFYVWAAGNGGGWGMAGRFRQRQLRRAVEPLCRDGGLRRRTTIDHSWPYYSEIGRQPVGVCTVRAVVSPPAGDHNDRRTPTVTRKDFGGTSAAAPIVSGVAALLRAANPDLTWRDLKLILAGSARRNNPDDEDYDPDDEDWDKGALKYGADGEHYWFNHEYGFGVVDAGAASDLAAGWTSPPGWREISATSHETGRDSRLDTR